MKKSFIILIIAFGLLSFVETNPFQQVKWVAPVSSKKITNPVSVKKRSASAKKGAKLFTQFCVACHGAQGKGDGVGGKVLSPKPANLTSSLVQGQVDGEIFWKISNGRNAMIKWGPIISVNDRWSLVNYIRILKK